MDGLWRGEGRGGRERREGGKESGKGEREYLTHTFTALAKTSGSIIFLLSDYLT